MKKLNLFSLVLVIALLFSCSSEKYKTKTDTDKNGYQYEYVTNDPIDARIYTLKNGLKIYLTINKDKPRFQALIAVRAGSKYDPPATTGLAHYCEHMMFKGSSKIGTIDYEKEKVLIQQISDLFEQHRKTTDTLEKKKIYAKIDSISQISAKYAVASEYDKMCSSVGAEGTNAFTGDEVTCYINNIPTNEIEKWLILEKERFTELVPRIFHTELETVYEEFNMSQDNDYRKLDVALNACLFKKHPYGTQTTIGKAEHLKNPSIVNLLNYWKTYYVPNNMAICISGDIDFEQTIQLIDKYFGGFKPSNSIPEFKFDPEVQITHPIDTQVSGPQPEMLNLAYRFDTKDKQAQNILTVIGQILNNGQAGLIDIDLVQKQKVLDAYAYSNFMQDYGMFVFGGNPREGQKLEEVKDLFLSEIEKIKKGNFDNWLPQACVNDLRLSQIQQMESNWRVFRFLDAFIMTKPWIEKVKELDELEKITKKQIVDFANKHFNNNYVVAYKRTGKDTNIVKLRKPPITPVELNRDTESVFIKNFKEIKTPQIQPVFLDFKKDIQHDKLKSGIEFSYIKNITNELFYLDYIIDMGKNHNKKLELAVKYLPYIGTTKYSPEDLRKEFFKLGLRMDVYTGDERSYVFINGLDKSYKKGVELLEHVLSECKPDKKAYNDFVDKILKERSDAKLEQWTILWSAMYSYGKYGKKSPFTDILSEQELRAINPEELTNILKELYTYKHHIFYYGPKELSDAKMLVNNVHNVPSELKPYPEPEKFTELSVDTPKVYFVHYDKVQASLLLISKDVLMDKTIFPYISMYNEFYGSGLSSIVFQEIRESRGLAYACYSSFSIPWKPGRAHYISAFIGAQPDKIDTALTTMLSLLNKMPAAQKQFDASKESIRKKIETDRITKGQIYWTYLSNKDKEIDYDYRKDTYEKVKTMTTSDLKQFFDEHIKGKKYNIFVLGNRENIDMKMLEKYGTVKELTLKEIFNY